MIIDILTFIFNIRPVTAAVQALISSYISVWHLQSALRCRVATLQYNIRIAIPSPKLKPLRLSVSVENAHAKALQRSAD